MPGALIHVAVGLLCAFIVHLRHFRLEFSNAIFIGNLLPDVIKFGAAMLYSRTLDPMKIDRGYLYQMLAENTSAYTVWFTIGFFLLAVLIFLYHFHVVQKRKMEEYAELWGFLLLGIIVHLVLDALFVEQGPWI
ncbi:MAG TPA: hypothetical protein VJK52_02475 [Candidatus Nanoarchaeia archaeon]|nr:hypothetical protein [Candidatus Nanoarchaeia archaeon]